jgi:hypothetical protein
LGDKTLELLGEGREGYENSLSVSLVLRVCQFRHPGTREVNVAILRERVKESFPIPAPPSWWGCYAVFRILWRSI